MTIEVLPEYRGFRRKIFSAVSISMRFSVAVSVLTWEVSEEVFLTVFFKEEDNADPEEKISGSKLSCRCRRLLAAGMSRYKYPIPGSVLSAREQVLPLEPNRVSAKPATEQAN